MGGGGETCDVTTCFTVVMQNFSLHFLNVLHSLELLIEDISLHMKPLDRNYAIGTGRDVFYTLS
jgi:hypothetical protein